VRTLYLPENEGFHSGKDEGNITKAAQRHDSNPAWPNISLGSELTHVNVFRINLICSDTVGQTGYNSNVQFTDKRLLIQMITFIFTIAEVFL